MLWREKAVCPVVACGERREAAGAVTAVGVERKYRRGMWKKPQEAAGADAKTNRERMRRRGMRGPEKGCTS